MKTSYFFSEKLKSEDNIISIAYYIPYEERFKNIKTYLPLVPSHDLVFGYKNKEISEKDYTREYNEILFKLDAKKVFLDLKDSIILCWESPEKFCHRHLVSKWLNSSLGLNILEL